MKLRFSLSMLIVSLVALGTSGVFLGCREKSDDKIKQYTNIQSEIEAANGIKAENENRIKWSSSMESDLQRRQRFYQALSGTYEGNLNISDEAYSIRITLVSSLPLYVPSDRVRLPEEVAEDLKNLYFNVQVVQWNPNSKYGAVGCLVSNVRPDINRGRISVSSENCPNLYLFQIAELEPSGRMVSSGDDSFSSRMASGIVEGRIGNVDRILGRMQPTTNSAVHHFTLTRVEE
jgi:hypothetical protein